LDPLHVPTDELARQAKMSLNNIRQVIKGCYLGQGYPVAEWGSGIHKEITHHQKKGSLASG